MRKILPALLLMFLYSQFCHSYVKTINLIYDSTEVYAGNKVRFSLEFINHRGKVFSSIHNNSRYNCKDVVISTSEGIVLEEVNENEFSILLNTDVQFKNVELYIVESKDKEKKRPFSFKIPVIDYNEQIMEARIRALQGSLSPGKEYDYTLEVLMNDGTLLYPTVDRVGRLRLRDFKVSILKGGSIIGDRKVLVSEHHLCETSLVFKIEHKSNAEISNVCEFEIRPLEKNVLDYNFNGADGVRGKSGRFGRHGKSGGVFRSADGGNGGIGSSGKKGSNGKSASDLEIRLSLAKDVCSEDTVLSVEVHYLDYDDKEFFQMPLSFESIEITAEGGDGGYGGNGGNGGDGRY